MFLHTYTFTINIVSLVSEVHYFVGVIPEYKRIIVKCAIKQSVMQIRTKEIEEGMSNQSNWAKHCRGKDPRPAKSPHAQGGGEAGQQGVTAVGCGHTAPSSS